MWIFGHKNVEYGFSYRSFSVSLKLFCLIHFTQQEQSLLWQIMNKIVPCLCVSVTAMDYNDQTSHKWYMIKCISGLIDIWCCSGGRQTLEKVNWYLSKITKDNLTSINWRNCIHYWHLNDNLTIMFEKCHKNCSI